MSVSNATIASGWNASLATRRLLAWLDSAAAWWGVLVATCLVLVGPLLLVDVPPLLDYPNHLARMYVLAFGMQDPILSQMYQQHWAIIPNLAIDLVMPAMLHLMSVTTAGRIVLAATLLLPVVGAVAYHRVAFGIRAYWPFTAALGAYNTLFLFGFMNFLLSLGMALLAAAAWLRWRDRHPIWVTGCGALVAVAIFFMHLFGLVFLAALVSSEELVRLRAMRQSGEPLWPHLRRPILMATAIIAPSVALLRAAPLDHLEGATRYRPLWHKLYGLAEPFLAYDGFVDVLTGGAFFVGLYILWRQRQLRFAPGIALALVALFAVYLVCPFAMKGTGFIDARFPIMLGLLLFAGLRPVALSARVRLTLGVVLALVFIARTTSLAIVWFDHNRDLAEFRQVIASVQPGDRVLVVSVDPQDVPDYWSQVPRGRRIPGFFRLDFHLPALLTIEHHAFIPYLFTVAAKQPLLVRPPYDRIAVPEGQPPDWQSLATGINAHPVTPAPYLTDWQHHFDYVLLLNAGGAGDLSAFLPDKLHLVAARDVAALYRIVRP